MGKSSSIFTCYFRYSDGEFNFEIGWFWIAVIIALAWWF